MIYQLEDVLVGVMYDLTRVLRAALILIALLIPAIYTTTLLSQAGDGCPVEWNPTSGPEYDSFAAAFDAGRARGLQGLCVDGSTPR